MLAVLKGIFNRMTKERNKHIARETRNMNPTAVEVAAISHLIMEILFALKYIRDKSLSTSSAVKCIHK
jgi:hypothetical protein